MAWNAIEPQRIEVQMNVFWTYTLNHMLQWSYHYWQDTSTNCLVCNSTLKTSSSCAYNRDLGFPSILSRNYSPSSHWKHIQKARLVNNLPFESNDNITAWPTPQSRSDIDSLCLWSIKKKKCLTGGVGWWQRSATVGLNIPTGRVVGGLGVNRAHALVTIQSLEFRWCWLGCVLPGLPKQSSSDRAVWKTETCFPHTSGGWHLRSRCWHVVFFWVFSLLVIGACCPLPVSLRGLTSMHVLFSSHKVCH
jgi:hypothetical protein